MEDKLILESGFSTTILKDNKALVVMPKVCECLCLIIKKNKDESTYYEHLFKRKYEDESNKLELEKTTI